MKKKYTFEEGIARAQSLVDSLEKGSMTLEDSFAAYEEATKILKSLEKMLDEGDKRIAVLTGEAEIEISDEVKA